MGAGRQITTSSPSTYDPSTDVLQGNRSGGNLTPITIPEATESQTGLMSASDKAALNAAAPQSTTYTKDEDDALLATKADLDASNITASTWLTALGINQHIAASGSITTTDGSGFSQLAWGGVVDDGDSQLVTLSTTLSDGDYRVQLYNDDGTELASCDYYIYSRTATSFRVMSAKPATYKYEVILS